MDLDYINSFLVGDFLKMNITQEEYDNDPRTPCKYGINCYQRNILHTSTYKHPPKRANLGKTAEPDSKIQPPNKKLKTDSEDTESKAKQNGNTNTNKIIQTGATDNNNLDLSAGPSKNVLTDIKEKDFIKKKFLVNMPLDFYNFWNFCKTINSKDPTMALKDVGLVLVGPFDVLAGKFNNTPEKEVEEYVLHWRYFYDPPEFQTVIMRNDNSGFHIGYFRDSPDEMPVFLAYNFPKTDGTFRIVGDNLFAAVGSFLDFQKKSGSPFMQSSVIKYINMIKKEAEKLKLNMSRTTPKITARNNKTLARTFNKLGFIVPYNKSTQLGYRPLSISNKELQDLLSKLDKATGTERVPLMNQLQVVLTNTSIAIDECDFGTGIELGLDILCSGTETLNSVVARQMATCYRLLNKEAFAIIIESHMKKRRKDFNLSVI